MMLAWDGGSNAVNSTSPILPIGIITRICVKWHSAYAEKMKAIDAALENGRPQW
jgi:hypothetical protein